MHLMKVQKMQTFEYAVSILMTEMQRKKKHIDLDGLHVIKNVKVCSGEQISKINRFICDIQAKFAFDSAF